jgi:CheY-like chemotaxis protein
MLNGSHGAEERQLPDIPGINVDQGIKRVVGNQTLYVELLRNFNRDFSGAAVEIQSALGKGDLKTAQRLAHTLKGVAGNLSAEVLQDRATELDGALKKEIAGSAEPPELILLDIMMPEMDGFEVLQKLKSDEKTRDIPVSFVTAKNEMDDRMRGFDLGVSFYITKPIDPAYVLDVVRKHFVP